jgi:hypothetical protein
MDLLERVRIKYFPTLHARYGRYKDCLPVLCGEENADRNAAFNIAYRALGYISKVGVTVNLPKLKLTFASAERNAMMTKEATYCNRR